MKTTITALAVITAVISKASWIWPLIEFCLYLFKDKEFNYFSLWFMLIAFVTAAVFMGLATYLNIKAAPKESTFQERLRDMANKTNPKKSAFESRLNEMENKRNKP